MNKLLTLFLLLAFCGCKKSTSACRPYLDAVKDGSIPRKTTQIKFSDSLSRELDYVRDQMYKEKTFYCFGYLELNRAAFLNTVKDYIKSYDPATVYSVDFIGKGKNICSGDSIDPSDIKALLVYHTDKDSYLTLDYVNLATGTKESNRISNVYASVSMYHIFEKSKIKDKPFLVTVKDKDIKDDGHIRFISKRDDRLYKQVHNK